jgi:hypothetical protein
MPDQISTSNIPQLTQVEVTDAIQESISMLLDRYGISSLPSNEQREAIDKIGDLLTSEIIARAVDRMDDEQAKKFSDFIDTDPSQENVLQRLMQNDPLFVQSINDVAEEFIAESDYIMGLSE